jgi:hypothetical protein
MSIFLPEECNYIEAVPALCSWLSLASSLSSAFDCKNPTILCYLPRSLIFPTRSFFKGVEVPPILFYKTEEDLGDIFGAFFVFS